MACISKSVPRDVISLSDCRPQLPRSAVSVTPDSWGWSLSVPFLHSSGLLRLMLMTSRQSGESRMRHLKCSTQDSSSAYRNPFWYCFCLWLPHRKRDVGASTLARRVSWEMHHLRTKTKSGSCRCICRKSHIEQSSCDDVTCFSNRCCNVRCLVETALWPLSFLLEVLGGRVSPRCWLCSRPFCPKLEIQHDKKRKRTVPTLTGKEWLQRECYSIMLIPKRKLWA